MIQSPIIFMAYRTGRRTRDAAFGEALQADLTCSWTSDELLAFAFNDKSHSPTNFEPGTQYQ
jgi:hypothetical protein